MQQAFAGVRIVDFTQVLSGPFAVMQLGLLGAEVIKIEQPGTGDQTRALMTDTDNGMSPSFMTCNLNKRSLTLDLKSAAAAVIIDRLIKTADVVVENFKAGTMSRLGFGYERLRQIKPDLIYCAVSGYGQTGARAGVAAYDGAIQAASGMMSQTGHPETGPTRTGYMPVDMATALNTAFAISAALYRKLRTGEGQFVDVAMLDTAIVVQAAQFSNYLNDGNLVGLKGNASPTNQPTADVFPTSDGFIQVTAIRDAQVKALFEVIGATAQLAVPAFATTAARIDNAPLVRAFVMAALQTNTTAFWMDRLPGAGVPVAEIQTLPQVVADDQLRSRGVLATLQSPLDPRHEVTVVKAGYVTDRDGPHIRMPPPLLGQHTDEILRELGFADETIQSWRQDGAI